MANHSARANITIHLSSKIETLTRLRAYPQRRNCKQGRGREEKTFLV